MKFQSACQPARQVLAGGSDWEKCEDHAKHWGTCLERGGGLNSQRSQCKWNPWEGNRWWQMTIKGRIKVESYWDRDNIRKENWTNLPKPALISFPWSKPYFNLIFFILLSDKNYLDYVGNKGQEQDQYPKHYLKSIREKSPAK